jgi:uncharacterized protein YndB with AHSA1/START domain
MNTNNTLNITLPAEREIVITRSFDAPPDLVFDALTKPELLRRWYGPGGWRLVVCDIDLQVGGAWRFVTERPDGKQIGQRGVYLEIVPGERLVNTESWEDWNPGETHVTTVLTERNGKTTFTSTILFPSREVRDTIVKSGLEGGVVELYDRLDEVLITMREAV